MSNQPTSKIIQISNSICVNGLNERDNNISALCEDGSVWNYSSYGGHWECILKPSEMKPIKNKDEFTKRIIVDEINKIEGAEDE